MLGKFRRIKDEFGGKAIAKLILLLAGLILVSVIGVFGLRTPWALAIVIVGLGLGWLLRSKIVEHFETLHKFVPAGAVVYGVVLFAGERLGGRDIQAIIIAATTVAMFDIYFWSLSDPTIVNLEFENVDTSEAP